MSPKTAIFKLHEMKEEQKLASKREALDVAIKAIEAHDVAMEVIRQEKACFCPSCKCFIGVTGFGRDLLTVDAYCKDCGQKLKAPEE